MFVPSEPLTLAAYIEECRIGLWDHAFISVFRGHDCFKKSDDFQGYKGTNVLVKIVLFRCLLCLSFMLWFHTSNLLFVNSVFWRFWWPFLFCRYFKYELLPKQAILKEDLPVFLSTWLDRSNAACMFTVAQQRTWTTSHLTSGAWYLDCATHYTPPFEMELRKSCEALVESAEDMDDF